MKQGLYDAPEAGAEMLQTSSQGLAFHLGMSSSAPVSAGQLDRSVTAASPGHKTAHKSAQTQVPETVASLWSIGEKRTCTWWKIWCTVTVNTM